MLHAHLSHVWEAFSVSQFPLPPSSALNNQHHLLPEKQVGETRDHNFPLPVVPETQAHGLPANPLDSSSTTFLKFFSFYFSPPPAPPSHCPFGLQICVLFLPPPPGLLQMLDSAIPEKALPTLLPGSCALCSPLLSDPVSQQSVVALSELLLRGAAGQVGTGALCHGWAPHTLSPVLS
jgi:hypothetical protein